MEGIDMKQYEVAEILKDGTICKGGIPTSKAHAQRWANQNAAMYPEQKFTTVEYDGRVIED